MALYFTIALVLWVAAILLAFHHYYIHREKPPDDGVKSMCLLQPSDVCVFSRWTHETPIILLVAAGGLVFVYGLGASSVV